MNELVLMIEDEEHIRIVFKDSMFDEGVLVVGVASGEEGVEFFREHAQEITLVVLDLSLPGISGEETYRQLKEIKQDVRIVVSSGFPEESVEKVFEGRDILGFLQKPYNYATLVGAMLKYLGRSGVSKQASG